MSFAAEVYSLPIAFSSPAPASAALCLPVAVWKATIGRPLFGATARVPLSYIRMTMAYMAAAATSGVPFAQFKGSPNSERSERIRFTNSARRVPDTGKVKTRTRNERKLKKGARNGL